MSEPSEVDRTTTIFGNSMDEPKGWIAELGQSGYSHRFGGDSWKVIDHKSVYGGPTLLVTLDLEDPKLELLNRSDLTELPLPSYINCNVWIGRQRFKIDPRHHTCILTHREVVDPEPLDEEDKFPDPLPEKPIFLREMKRSELPVDEDTYELACEEFVGGQSFIRIMGPPIWLHDAETEISTGGYPMQYIGSIGYENYYEPRGYLDDEPFFIGEGALYFFFSPNEFEISVLSQST